MFLGRKDKDALFETLAELLGEVRALRDEVGTLSRRMDGIEEMSGGEDADEYSETALFADTQRRISEGIANIMGYDPAVARKKVKPNE